MRAPIRQLVVGIGFAVCLGFAGVSHGQERPTYSAHWAVNTSPTEIRWRNAPDWAAMVDFGTAPVQRNVIVLYEHLFLLDVRTQGLHITMSPQWWTAYESRLREHVAQQVPSPEFDGYLVLDVEFLDVFWGDRTAGPGISPVSHHSRAQFDYWYDYIRRTSPQTLVGSEVQREARLKAGYESAVRELFQRTIEICKSVRPGAKVGFYGFPLRRHGEYARADAERFRTLNDSMSWLFEAQDALFPELYQQFVMVENDRPVNWTRTWRQRDLETLMRSNIVEARRLAGEKPVLVFTMVRYSELSGNLDGQRLPANVMDLALASPKSFGADGIVIWDHLRSAQDFHRLQRTMNEEVNARLASLLTPLDNGQISASASQPGTSQQPPATPPTVDDRRSSVDPAHHNPNRRVIRVRPQPLASTTPATGETPSTGGGGQEPQAERRFSNNWRNLVRRNLPYRVQRPISPIERALTAATEID